MIHDDDDDKDNDVNILFIACLFRRLMNLENLKVNLTSCNSFDPICTCCKLNSLEKMKVMVFHV